MENRRNKKIFLVAINFEFITLFSGDIEPTIQQYDNKPIDDDTQKDLHHITTEPSSGRNKNLWIFV